MDPDPRCNRTGEWRFISSFSAGTTRACRFAESTSGLLRVLNALDYSNRTAVFKFAAYMLGADEQVWQGLLFLKEGESAGPALAELPSIAVGPIQRR